MNPHSWFYRTLSFSRCSCTAVVVVVVVVLTWSNSAFCDEIHDAAADGDLAKVQALLNAKPDLVSSRDGNGDTPLHHAAARGHLDIAKLLLSNNAPVNATNSVGETPLHSAAATGRTELAELLLVNHANANAKANNGETPLHLAAYSGHKEVARLLLANNAEVNARDNDGATPLHRAVHRHKDLAALLRQHGGQDLPAVARAPKTTPSIEVQDQISKSAQRPAILRNLGGAGRTLSHWLPGGSVPYPELVSIDGKGPGDFGLKNKRTFGDKFNVSIPPGQHTLLVQFWTQGYNRTIIRSAQPLSLGLPAESGHLYVLEARYVRDGLVPNGWAPFVVDATNEEHPIVILTPSEANKSGSPEATAQALKASLLEAGRAGAPTAVYYRAKTIGEKCTPDITRVELADAPLRDRRNVPWSGPRAYDPTPACGAVVYHFTCRELQGDFIGGIGYSYDGTQWKQANSCL